jgi:hypothetical protein
MISARSFRAPLANDAAKIPEKDQSARPKRKLWIIPVITCKIIRYLKPEIRNAGRIYALTVE